MSISYIRISFGDFISGHLPRPRHATFPSYGSLMKKIFFPALIFLFLLIPPCWAETYENWIARCRSYKDVAEWLNENFLYDLNGTRKGANPGRYNRRFVKIKDIQETFQCKTGMSAEAAVFTKHSLNRINPNYRAEIIYLLAENSSAHYVCGFHLGGKLFIMDYGSPYENMIGTHGPFDNLDEYVQKFYLKYHPLHLQLQSYNTGWPPSHSWKHR